MNPHHDRPARGCRSPVAQGFRTILVARARNGQDSTEKTKAVALEQQLQEFVRLRGNHPLSREFALSE